MAIFNSYVKSPEGIKNNVTQLIHMCELGDVHSP